MCSGSPVSKSEEGQSPAAPGKDFVTLIAVMRKERGADPAHNDWLFIEYTRVNKKDSFSELARGAVCTSCHVGAEGADYVWTLAR